MKIKRIIAAVLCLAALLSLAGCAGGPQFKGSDLMAGIKARAVEVDIDLSDNEALAEFAVRLFKSSNTDGENILISPLSVICALAMTANGAQGETLEQMEEVFGLSVPELNEYLSAYMKNLPSGEKYKLSLANSIWFKDEESFAPEKDFLQTNADYYDAAVYKAPFDDSTRDEINEWVEENTDGMIEDILDKIPADAIMYLINALAFDAEWADIYNENEVREGEFTTESGEEQSVELMYNEEGRYLDDGSATGFIKPYADGKYAFAALLPNEGISVGEYLESLSGEGLMDTLNNAGARTVNTAIPKFESEYSAELNDVLISMGMTDAFDPSRADLSGISKATELFISRVIHKTYINVDEKGTQAGAATVVEVGKTSAGPTDPKSVILDRPFVYMLIDCETNLPFFIGTLMSVS